jgi:peptidoglycan/LPS O-acetylase OafA/YrhL
MQASSLLYSPAGIAAAFKTTRYEDRVTISSTPANGRMRELDSLRGLAAFTVVIHHFVLMWPQLLSSLGIAEFHTLPITLLYPFYAGHEAVMLFFVLSGVVLALPYLRGRNQGYPIFLARRILRIYGPYLGALALAIAGAAIWHGNLGHGAWPSAFWSESVHPQLVLQHVLFLGAYNWNQFDFVIWSLIYEMRISIIFPLLVAFILRRSTASAILTAAGVSLLALAASNHHDKMSPTYNLMMTFHYTAFFILGILVARNLAAISAWYRSLSRVSRAALLLTSFLFYNLSTPIDHISSRLVAFVIGDWGVALGAIGYIVIGLHSTVARRILNSAIPAFLGRISYSLYLVHGIVLLAMTFALRNRLSAVLQLPVYLAVAVGLSFLFCVWVEEPFTRLGHQLSRGNLLSKVKQPSASLLNPSRSAIAKPS